jgi:hypothetical protein
LVLNFKNDKTIEPTSYSFLSPGETIWLLNLLITYEISNFPSRRDEFQGSVLLLDEPDAHLHPSLVKIFFDTVTKYVNNYGVQVIMTTHNPETVYLVPDVKCLFYMERDDKTKEVCIKPAKNKTHCAQLLTSNIIYVNESFRMVFVETDNDKVYFECINSYLIKHSFLINIQQLIFVCLPVKTHKKTSIAKEAKLFNVRELISILTESYNDKTSLENFAYGIVKCRHAQEILPQNIQQLERCGIENYILDPINVFYYIISNEMITKEIPDITHVLRWNELATKCRLKSIHQMLSEPDNISTLQSIIDFMDQFLSKIIGPKEDDIDVQISKTPIILKYPEYFIKKDRSTLETAYTKLHSQLNLENILKFIIDKKDAIIPKDLVEIFEYLHSPIPENRS